MDEIVLVDVSSLLDLLKRTTIETADYEFNSHEGPSGPNSFPVSFLQLKVDLRNLEFYVIQPSSASPFVALTFYPGIKVLLFPSRIASLLLVPIPLAVPARRFSTMRYRTADLSKATLHAFFLVTT